MADSEKKQQPFLNKIVKENKKKERTNYFLQEDRRYGRQQEGQTKALATIS